MVIISYTTLSEDEKNSELRMRPARVVVYTVRSNREE